DLGRRREYADLLTRICKKPPPWTYWGFRPPPRPANSVTWERTAVIEQALARTLEDPDRTVRLDVLRRMAREKIAAPAATLGKWLQEERDAERVASILHAFRGQPAASRRPHLERVVRDREHTTANRLLAVSLALQGLDAPGEGKLLAMAEAIEDGPVLAEMLRALRRLPAASPLLLRKLTSTEAEVRAAAIDALAELQVPESHKPIRKLLDDADARVRSAAAMAAGKLSLRTAVEQLLRRAGDANADVRRSSLDALRRLREPQALPLAVTALADRETALKALEYLGELGGPEHARAVTDLGRRDPSVEVLNGVGKVLAGWAARKGVSAARRQEIEQALADLHGSSGVVLAWYALGPMDRNSAADLMPKLTSGQSSPTGANPAPNWRVFLAAGIDARARFGAAKDPDSTWVGYSEIVVTESSRVEFFTAGTGQATVWLNGKEVYRRDRPGVTGPYPDRFDAVLAKGSNRVVVQLTVAKGNAELQLRFRRKSATPDHERLTRAALSRAGNPAHGRQIFLNAEKSLCIKCHRVGEQGERIGPELTGLGSRFAKVYIVESILEPSRTISPSFETVLVVLKDGKTLSGVKVDETETSLTLADSEAKRHVLARVDIEEVRRHAVSSMPEGLERRLTEDEFVDLISFLANLKEKQR
ncbi:MAG TPA: HEAT repeat domain-containing protein, partial [Gemmataceae bacterium]|nr:HEAT repeat domain-containing protein [Gemmataceae bacterium]